MTGAEGRSRSLSRRSLLVALIPSVSIVVALASLFVVTTSKNDAARGVAHSDRVELGATRTLSLLVDAETGVRGYGATGSPRFLEPYDQAVRQLPGTLSALRAAIEQDPPQRTRVATLSRLSESLLHELDALRRSIADEPTSAPNILNLTTRQKATMDRIRAVVTDIDGAERVERSDRERRAATLDRVAVAVTVAGGAVGILGGLVVAWAMSRSESERLQAERQRAAQALLDSEQGREHSEIVFRSSAAGIATIGLDGRCTSINPVGAEILGYDVEDLIDRDLHALVHHRRPDGRAYPAEECAVRGAMWRDARVDVDDEVIWRRDGERVPVAYSAASLRTNGVVSGVVVTFADISDRRGPTMVDERSAELRAAIANAEFVLHYQPKVEVATGNLLGVEALVRWQHPSRGLVFPDEFIALAEETGHIEALTDWLVDEAVQQQARWKADGLDLSVAVNLSVRSLADAGFPDRVSATCRRHGVTADRLELEVTESAVMANPDQSVAVLDQLVQLGHCISIDDFGTGFSSLAYLRNLPVTTVKIDKSFVMSLPDSNEDAHIVRGTIDLVHGLGKKVVAEGVESIDALNFLLLVGCDAAQGYYWSRPVPADALIAWADQHGPGARFDPAGVLPVRRPADEESR
jgi:PAS domain S-box-containing protein